MNNPLREAIKDLEWKLIMLQSKEPTTEDNPITQYDMAEIRALVRIIDYYQPTDQQMNQITVANMKHPKEL